MSNGNHTDLVGNATRDPELRFTPGGMPVINFGLAVNRRTQNRQTQEWEERTSFFDVVAYGTLAENVAECVQRGARLMVSGRLEQRSWETQEGEKRSKIEVIADDIGPSLRWATADVTKNERRDDNGRQSNGGGRQQGRPQSRQQDHNEEPAYSGGGAPTYDADEEPF